jgi:hypothetical protein
MAMATWERAFPLIKFGGLAVFIKSENQMNVDLLEGPKMVLLISNPQSKAATTVNFPSPSETGHVLFLLFFL